MVYGRSGFDSLTYEGQEYLMNGSILQVDSLQFGNGAAGSVSASNITYNQATHTTLLPINGGAYPLIT